MDNFFDFQDSVGQAKATYDLYHGYIIALMMCISAWFLSKSSCDNFGTTECQEGDQTCRERECKKAKKFVVPILLVGAGMVIFIVRHHYTAAKDNKLYSNAVALDAELSIFDYSRRDGSTYGFEYAMF